MSQILKLRKDILSEERGARGRKGLLNIALLYPNDYNIAISTLAFHRIFELTRRVENTGQGRFFLSGEKNKFILSLEDEFNIKDATILAFFLSYELDYLNVIRALKILSIPIKSEERSNSFPIIIGGGTAITENPEPLADVLDVIFIGESEESYPKFLKLFFKISEKERILERASEIEGVYVPSIQKNAGKRAYYKGFVEDFSKSVFFSKRGEFGECNLIEISRGCPARCKFCISRTLYSPVRFAEKDLILDVIEKSLVEKIGLVGAATSYHPYIKEIMEFIVKNDKKFSISSLRADLIDRDFLSLLKLGGTKTITIAPEAGTQRLRDFISKGIKAEDIERAIILTLNEGFDSVRLYFMFGLPSEEREDLEGIIKIAEKIRMIEKAEKKRFKKKSFTLSPFVPKPHTPFSKYPFEDVKILSEKVNYLRKNLVSLGIDVLYEHPKTAKLEYEIAIGDRETLKSRF